MSTTPTPSGLAATPTICNRYTPIRNWPIFEAQLDQYKKELNTGATALAGLVKRDLKGDLPATGKRVNLGSLNLLGSKMGGLGIYTKPEDMYFANSQILEETDEYVIARVPGMMESNVFGGAIAYGVNDWPRTRSTR